MECPTEPPLTAGALESATPAELLSLASRLGRTDLVVTALRQGAEINALTPTPTKTDPHLRQTALHQAVLHGHVDATRALLASAAAPDIADTDSRTPLSCVDLDAHQKIWQVFAADMCQKAGKGDVAGLLALVDGGFPVGAADGVGNTPLHWAASFGRLSAVDFLLDRGAGIDPSNDQGRTPLCDAVLGGHIKVVRALVKAGADTAAIYHSGKAASEQALSEEVLGALQRRDSGDHHDGHAENDSERARDGVKPGSSRDSADTVPPTPDYTPGKRAILNGRAPRWAHLLWPRPQRLVETPGTFTLPPIVNVSAEGSCLRVGRKLVAWLQQLHLPDVSVRLVGGGHGGLGEHIMFSAAVFLRVDPFVLEASHQAYSLTVRHYGIDVVGSDLSGLMYGCATLVNVLQLRKGPVDDDTSLSVPTCNIEDWPSVRRRGLYVDASGYRIPRLETLKEIVSFMSLRLKMNQLHLNLGENFGSLRDEARDELMTHEEVIELDQWCADHFVQLIPVMGKSPERFGQIKVAEVASVQEDQLERRRKNPPLPRKEILFDEFIPLFSGEQVNLGVHSRKQSFDMEEFTLLRRDATSLRYRDKRNVLIFGEKLLESLSDDSNFSRIIPEIPAQIIIIAEACNRAPLSLDEQCLRLRRNGVPFYTCASSCLEWSLSGRLSICLNRVREAVTVAKSHGAVGVVLKDTSMNDLGAPLTFLYQMLIPMAGSAWNSNFALSTTLQGAEELLPNIYDIYLFRDKPEKGVLGSVAVSLTDLHHVAGDPDGNVLFTLLSRPQSAFSVAFNKVTYSGLRRVVKRADRIERALSTYHGNAHQNDVKELRASAVFMSVAARIGALLLSTFSVASMEGGKVPDRADLDVSVLPDGRRSDLCNSLLQAIEISRSTWMNQYQAAGFAKSVDLAVGVALAKLAQGMPYQKYLQERKAKDWVPLED